jgi:hypothetical protein
MTSAAFFLLSVLDAALFAAFSALVFFSVAAAFSLFSFFSFAAVAFSFLGAALSFFSFFLAQKL